MEQRVSLITVGAEDPARLAAFYDALGWSRVETPDGVIAYDLIGMTFGLYPLDKLAEEMSVPIATLGRGAVTLSHNVASKEEVSSVLAAATAAGARLIKPASDVFWGGHHGYFSDPEGNIWEVAFNSFSPLRDDGAFRWNGYG